MMMLLAVGGTVDLNISVIGDTEISPTNPSASVQLNTDGTITYTGNDSVGDPNWFIPTTTGIGSSYWCKLHVDSGTNPTSGDALDTVLALSSVRNWQWSRSTLGTTSATCTLSIYSDSGGTNLVDSDSFTVAVTKDA